MPHPDSERGLRRIAAEFASLHAEDIAAILGDLNTEERARIEALLREYSGHTAQPPVLEPAREFDASALSPWLVQRAKSAEPRIMTALARQALLDCAVELCPASAKIALTRTNGNSFLGRFAWSRS